MHDIGESKCFFCRDRVVDRWSIRRIIALAGGDLACLQDRKTNDPKISQVIPHVERMRSADWIENVHTRISIKCMRSAIILACCQHICIHVFFDSTESSCSYLRNYRLLIEMSIANYHPVALLFLCVSFSGSCGCSFFTSVFRWIESPICKLCVSRHVFDRSIARDAKGRSRVDFRPGMETRGQDPGVV